MGISSESWDFGDGVGATGSCPAHHYSSDGTYRLTLTVSTEDGRRASTSRDVVVRTHDVAVATLSVPQAATVGQACTISVGLTNGRYPETVQVALLKSIVGEGWAQVGELMQDVPVRDGGGAANLGFDYTFVPQDAQLGTVSFQAIATIQGARDAAPGDNTLVSPATRVTG